MSCIPVIVEICKRNWWAKKKNRRAKRAERVLLSTDPLGSLLSLIFFLRSFPSKEPGSRLENVQIEDYVFALPWQEKNYIKNVISAKLLPQKKAQQANIQANRKHFEKMPSTAGSGLERLQLIGWYGPVGTGACKKPRALQKPLCFLMLRGVSVLSHDKQIILRKRGCELREKGKYSGLYLQGSEPEKTHGNYNGAFLFALTRALLNHETPKRNTETGKRNTETALLFFFFFS